jgi:hypothetical protein
MKQPISVVRSLIETVLSAGKGVTNRERRFLEDLSEQLDRRGEIPDVQEDLLLEIFREKTA